MWSYRQPASSLSLSLHSPSPSDVCFAKCLGWNTVFIQRGESRINVPLDADLWVISTINNGWVPKYIHYNVTLYDQIYSSYKTLYETLLHLNSVPCCFRIYQIVRCLRGWEIEIFLVFLHHPGKRPFSHLPEDHKTLADRGGSGGGKQGKARIDGEKR